MLATLKRWPVKRSEWFIFAVAQIKNNPKRISGIERQTLNKTRQVYFLALLLSPYDTMDFRNLIKGTEKNPIKYFKEI